MRWGWSVTPALALLIGGVTIAAQSPLFTSRVEGVRVDVLVTERGKPVAGLQPTDFELRDNGVAQSIDLVNLGDVPINVVLTLDVSASVAGPRLENLRRAGMSLLDALTFNGAPMQRVALTTEVDEVRSALAAADAWGDTALVDASLGAMLVGDTDAGRTLVVLFSDGVDTASFTQPDLVVETARRVNGVVYAVSTSEDTPRFLSDLTAATGGRVLDIGRTDDPGPAFLEILREFRRRYLITFTPTGVTRAGWHKLEVRVKRSGTRAQARSGYFSSAP